MNLKIIWLFLTLVVLAVALAALVHYLTPQSTEPVSVACTQEAKICSDGSSVGRTGPNCEFTACPKADLITVDAPSANSTISSPLIVTGQARGTWYFEASFPVKLYDENNNLIASGPAQAQADWMTDNFVPFKITLPYTVNHAQQGKIVLQKDNPSGDPAKDDSLVIPVMLQP